MKIILFYFFSGLMPKYLRQDCFHFNFQIDEQS